MSRIGLLLPALLAISPLNSPAATPGAPVTAEPRIPVEAFAKTPPFSAMSLSPDGEYLAVNADYGEGSYALLVYRLSDMKGVSMLRFPRYQLASEIRWVSNTRLIVAKAQKSGALEEPLPTGDILAADFDGKHTKYIYGYEQTTKNGGLSRGYGYIAGVPPKANGHFYMRQFSLSTRHSMLYDIDASNAGNHLIADIAVPDLHFVLDHAGEPVYALGVDDDDHNLLYRANGHGGWTQLTNIQSSWIPLALSEDGQHVYGKFSDDGGPMSLVLSDLDGGNRQTLASDPFYDVYDLQWTNTPSHPFAVQMGTAKPSVKFLDQGQESLLYQGLLKSLPNYAIDFIDYSADGNRVLIYVGSDRDAGGLYLFDRATNKLNQLLLTRPQLAPGSLGERKVVRFQTRDKHTLDAVLTFPAQHAAGTPLPMILLPHGGPVVTGDGWEYDNDAQFLASRGYLVLQVNYRGGLGRGHDFEAAGYRQWGKAIQNDLIDGVHWTIDQGLADPNRICAFGASFGAYSALMVAAREPSLLKCTVGLAGVYDLQIMHHKGDIPELKYGRNYLVRAIGEDEAELAANSPTTLAAKIKVPVFLAHGEQDDRAPLAQAKEMRTALEKAGNAPKWMQVPKEGHGFYNEANSIAFYRELEAFLAKNLGNNATPTSTH